QSLWFDEAATVRIVRQDFGTMMSSIKDDERIPPLHYWILHGWVRVFGHAEWSVRFPSALAGMGAVWVLYLLTKRLFGVGAALVAALLLAVAPYQIQYAQEARSYSLMVLTSLLSCWLFVRLLDKDRPKPRLEAGYVLAGAAAIYSHLYAIFTLLAQAVTYALEWTRSEKSLLGMRRWVVMQIAITALFLPWLPTAIRWARSVGSGFWVRPMTHYDLWAAYVAYAGGSSVMLILLLMLVLVGVIAQRRNVRGLSLMLALATLPVVVPTVVSILTKPTFTPRYGIVAPAALFALAGCGVIALRHRVTQLGAAIVLAALSLYAIPDIARKPDWRGTVAYVESVARPKDYIVMTPRRSTYLYDYYAKRHDVTRKGFDSGAIPLSVPLDPPGTRVWFIYEPTYNPKEVLDRGGWRVRSSHVSRRFRELWILELVDGPPASSPDTPGED
ncbi:MAG: glycosyltransferase family 39 protein, partial [Planctomycetota bacterium]|nr:glycosyltransferase family 39 protein [Planctomycetota bacterium]